jgi:YD repeat-containing protein
MKQTPFYYLLIFTFLSLSLLAQKKKDLRKNNIRCMTITQSENEKTITDSKEFFNAKGEKIQDLNFDSTGVLKKTTTYKYNASSDVIEETDSDASGTVLERRTYSYNALGEKIQELVKDKNGKQIKRIEYSYNPNGLKSEKRTFDSANKLIAVKKYNYVCTK